MTFIYGMLTATVAIIIAEIVLNYGLGDKVKDLFLAVFGKANAAESDVKAEVLAEIAKFKPKAKK